MQSKSKDTTEQEHCSTCDVCGLENSLVNMFHGRAIRPTLLPFIQNLNPNWSLDANICLFCLHKVRSDFMESSLKLETGEIGEVERQVLEALRNSEIISLGLDNSEKKTTFGNRVSDKIASFGGSWKFIIGFLFVLFIWL